MPIYLETPAYISCKSSKIMSMYNVLGTIYICTLIFSPIIHDLHSFPDRWGDPLVGMRDKVIPAHHHG